MGRKKRIWYPGAFYHVMSRGNRRSTIFIDEQDYIDFMKTIGLVKEKYIFRIHSLCLMTNHFHMAIETPEVPLGKIMQRLLGVYAGEFNYRHQLNGHLFEGRYTAQLIEDERYFLEVSRYIHLNPVKAGIVREPIEYKYSSYGMFVPEPENTVTSAQYIKSKVGSLMWKYVENEKVLSIFGNDSKEQYRMFVESRISHVEQEMQIRKEMKEDEYWLPGGA